MTKTTATAAATAKFRSLAYLESMDMRMTKRWVVGLVVAGLGCVSALAQDPLKTLPNNYRSIFENDAVTVIRAHYGPHEKVPVHDHTSFSTVFVYLSDSGPVRIDHVEEKVFSVVRPPTVKGAYRVATGMAERHSIENLGDLSSDFLRVELKKVSFRFKEPFRGKAPVSLAQSEDVVEFNDPQAQIERIVCVGSAACPVKLSTAPSLIVALGPAYLDMELGVREKVETGAVRWLGAGVSGQLGSNGSEAAQVLRILLPNSGR